MGIAKIQKFLGHEDIATTQSYAVMDTSTLRKKFASITAPPAKLLVQQIQQIQGDQVAAFASDLLRK